MYEKLELPKLNQNIDKVYSPWKYMKLETKKRWLPNFSKKYDWWVKFFGWSLGVLFLVFNLMSFINPIIIENIGNLKGSFTVAIWYSTLGTFTVQSNFITGFFLLWYLVKPKHLLFKNHSLIIALCSYMTITFIGYNFFIGVRINYATWRDWSTATSGASAISSIWQHLFAPVLVVLFWILDAKTYREKYLTKAVLIPRRVYLIVATGLIYPVLFLLYAIIVSQANAYVVYNGFTNLNSNLGFLPPSLNSSSVAPSDPYMYYHAAGSSTYTQISWVSGNQVLNSISYNSNPDSGSITYGTPLNLFYYLLFIIFFAGSLFIYRYCFLRRIFAMGWKPRQQKKESYLYQKWVK